MVIKVYIAMISCSQEVKKNQQRAIMILESKNVPYVAIDITDPEGEESKDYMLANAQPKPGHKICMTPQMFNEADYCGDFDTMDMSNECDTLGDFLKLSEVEKKEIKIGITGILPEERQKAREDEKRLQQKKLEPVQQQKPQEEPEQQQKPQEEPVLTNGVTTSREGSTEKKSSDPDENSHPDQPSPSEPTTNGAEETAVEPSTDPSVTESPPSETPAETGQPSEESADSVQQPLEEPTESAQPSDTPAPTEEGSNRLGSSEELAEPDTLITSETNENTPEDCPQTNQENEQNEEGEEEEEDEDDEA